MDPISHKRKYSDLEVYCEKKAKPSFPDEFWHHILSKVDIHCYPSALSVNKKWRGILKEQSKKAKETLNKKVYNVILQMQTGSISDQKVQDLCLDLSRYLQTVQHKIGRLILTPEPVIKIGSRVSMRLNHLPHINALTSALFCNLSFLQVLDLRNWSWVMHDPSSLSHLISLKKLILPIRVWEKPYWKALAKIQSLEEVVIYKSRFEILDGMYLLKQIIHLELIECEINHQIFKKMDRMTCLARLNLIECHIFHGNPINPPSPYFDFFIDDPETEVSEVKQLSKLPHLKKLNLTKVTMSQETLIHFLSLEQLEELILNNNSSAFLDPEKFSQLINLKKLDVEGITFFETLDLSYFSSLIELRSLSIKVSWWQGHELSNIKALANLPKLEALAIQIVNGPFRIDNLESMTEAKLQKWIDRSDAIRLWKDYLALSQKLSLKEITLPGFPSKINPDCLYGLLKKIKQRLHDLTPLAFS